MAELKIKNSPRIKRLFEDISQRLAAKNYVKEAQLAHTDYCPAKHDRQPQLEHEIVQPKPSVNERKL